MAIADHTRLVEAATQDFDAAMLPKHRRGYYSDLSKATTETIERE